MRKKKVHYDLAGPAAAVAVIVGLATIEFSGPRGTIIFMRDPARRPWGGRFRLVSTRALQAALGEPT